MLGHTCLELCQAPRDGLPHLCSGSRGHSGAGRTADILALGLSLLHPCFMPPLLALPLRAWRPYTEGSPTPVSCAGDCTINPGPRWSCVPFQGLPSLWGPSSPSQQLLPTGEHLRVCPQGYTCCTSEMEEKLANRSRAELEAALLDSGRALQTTFATQLQSFDGEQAPGLGGTWARGQLSGRGRSRRLCTSLFVHPVVCTAVHVSVWGDQAQPLSGDLLALEVPPCHQQTGTGLAPPTGGAEPGQGTEAGPALLWEQEVVGAPGVAFLSPGQRLGGWETLTRSHTRSRQRASAQDNMELAGMTMPTVVTSGERGGSGRGAPRK